MTIEAPVVSPYIPAKSGTPIFAINWNIEASRTIAGALARQRLRCHVASGTRKTAEINENLSMSPAISDDDDDGDGDGELELRAPT